ncbi:hypothetical protein BSKO_01162 [Bryopsis sp. KO-2023]|nr:hypothetical protein BSKO_01162 [Bryopsis sp. KO-2023]
MSRVSAAEHTIIGGMAGMGEVTIMQPIVAIKNALQEGRAVPWNVAHLYRGLGINILSMAPITATQFGANRMCEQLTRNITGRDVDPSGRVFCAAAAGAISGFVGSPAELLVIQQQKNGRSIINETKAVVQNYGLRSLFCRGLALSVCRESIYAGNYLGLYPVLERYLEESPDMAKYPKGTPSLAAGVAAGFLGSFLSHPFDTVKTRLQAHMYSRPEYVTSLGGMATVCREEGVGGLWKGYTPRGFRILCAVFILNGFRTYMVDHLENARAEQVAVNSEWPMKAT